MDQIAMYKERLAATEISPEDKNLVALNQKPYMAHFFLSKQNLKERLDMNYCGNERM